MPVSQPYKLLTDADIVSGYIASIYAFNRAPRGTDAHTELKAKVSRWQSMEDTVRKDRYGFPTGANYRCRAFETIGCPKPQW